jgi:hypothetical protein
MYDYNAQLKMAHDRSANNRAEIEASGLCGCFYCLHVFPPSDIEEWTDRGATPFCPKCGIDSVLGDKSGFPITPEFLGDMNRHWF